MNACAESAVSFSRIMTPAFTHAWTFSVDATRATTSASPDKGCHTYWKASAAPQTSAPAPFTVKVPFDAVADPAGPTAPMSCAVHGAGTPDGGGGGGGGGGGADTARAVTLSNVAMASRVSSWLETPRPT